MALNGKSTGEADVEFRSHEDAVAAMSKDKNHMRMSSHFPLQPVCPSVDPCDNTFSTLHYILFLTQYYLLTNSTEVDQLRIYKVHKQNNSIKPTDKLPGFWLVHY